MAERSDVATTSKFVTISPNLLLMAAPAWIFSVATLLLLVIAISDSMNKEPTNRPGVWQMFPLLLGMAAFAWWSYWRMERRLLRLGREGIELSLRFVVLRQWSPGVFASILFGRTRYGFIRWDELTRVEPRDSIPEYPCRGRFSPALVLEGKIWPILKGRPAVENEPMDVALAIQAAWISSCPSRVAAKIEPYWNDRQLRQTLPSLWET